MNYRIFRHLAIDGSKPAPSEADIRALEHELGAALPPSFREYLNAANGGYLEYCINVPTGHGNTESMLFGSLFGIGDKHSRYETFSSEIELARECHDIPKGVLPFARDGGGSTVFLDLTTEGKGRVIAFVYGLPAWAGKRTESSFIELAASFDEYVSKLHVDRELLFDQLENDVSELAHIEATEEWLDIGLPDWRHDAEIAKAMHVARERVSV
jgi:cell wall assembly regulator SMI1